MKHITIIFVLLMAVATQAVAVGTTMVCDARGGETRYYKYVSPFFGKPTVEQKFKGRWGDWCRPFDGYKKPCELEVSDNKSKITEYYEVYATKNVPSLDLIEGDKILKVETLVIDFEVAKRIFKQRYFKQKNGGEIDDWRDGEEYSCQFLSE